MFILVFVLRGELTVSERTFTCIGDAVMAWREMGMPCKDHPDWSYVAEKLGDMLERVTVPLGYTVSCG